MSQNILVLLKYFVSTLMIFGNRSGKVGFPTFLLNTNSPSNGGLECSAAEEFCNNA